MTAVIGKYCIAGLQISRDGNARKFLSDAGVYSSAEFSLREEVQQFLLGQADRKRRAKLFRILIEEVSGQAGLYLCCHKAFAGQFLTNAQHLCADIQYLSVNGPKSVITREYKGFIYRTLFVYGREYSLEKTKGED